MVDLDGDCDQDVIWAVFGPTTMDEPESHIFVFLQESQ